MRKRVHPRRVEPGQERQRRPEDHPADHHAGPVPAVFKEQEDVAPEEREDRARGARGDPGSADQKVVGEGKKIAGEASREIEKGVADRAEHIFKIFAQRKEDDHVVCKMHEPEMQEHRGKKPPVLPLLYERGGRRAEAQHRRIVLGPSQELRGEEDDQVGGEKDVGSAGCFFHGKNLRVHFLTKSRFFKDVFYTKSRFLALSQLFLALTRKSVDNKNIEKCTTHFRGGLL